MESSYLCRRRKALDRHQVNIQNAQQPQRMPRGKAAQKSAQEQPPASRAWRTSGRKKLAAFQDAIRKEATPNFATPARTMASVSPPATSRREIELPTTELEFAAAEAATVGERTHEFKREKRTRRPLQRNQRLEVACMQTVTSAWRSPPKNPAVWRPTCPKVRFPTTSGNPTMSAQKVS